MISYNIICRKGNDFVDMNALAGKFIIVQNQDRAHEYLLQSGITDNIVLMKNIQQGLELLNSEPRNALLSFGVSSFYFVRKRKYKDLIGELNYTSDLHNDRSRISQILINSFTNATKSPKEGSITLHTESARTDQVEISVIDTGIGIEADKLHTVFERTASEKGAD